MSDFNIIGSPESEIDQIFFKDILPNLLINSQSLYHYTTAEGLIGIIENNEFWATERRYMNDMNEETHPVG